MKDKDYNKVRFCYFDADPIVYRAGFGSQKTKYIFRDNEGSVASPTLGSAREATVWLEDLEEFGQDTSCYKREPIIEYLSEAKAIAKFDSIIEEYRKKAGNHITHFVGFLTPSGDKHKCILGTEDQYQLQRTGTEKPKHHKALKSYAASLSFIKMSPLGYEADELLIYNAERKGDKGVVMSIDKDMNIAQNTWVIHLQKDGSGDPVWNTELGHLDLYRKGTDVKGTGGGFKFLAYQALAGDRSDHYFGLKNFGPVKAVELIHGCESQKEVVQKCLEVYTEVYGESHSYTSWDGQEITKTPLEMLQMHFEMPYMSKGPNDTGINLENYLNEV